MKPIRFVGASKNDLSAFPASARNRAGHDLFMVQCNRSPADWKPMSGIGPGACEIRIRVSAGAYRLIYVACFDDAVYVLHAFQKKTQKTSKGDLELARQRYREAEAFSKRNSTWPAK